MNCKKSTSKRKNYRNITPVLAVIVLILLVSNTLAQQDAFGVIDRLYIDSFEGSPSQDVPVKFSITNDEPLSSISIPITYDTNILTLKEITFSGSRIEYISNKLVTPSNVLNVNGHFMAGMFIVFEDPLPPGDGMIFTVVFNINESAPDGQVTFIDSLFYPPAGELILVEATSSGMIKPIFQQGRIAINATNRSPLFSNISDQQVFEGENLDIKINASDSDNDNLVIACSNLPSGATFTDNHDGTADFSWQPGFVGPFSSDGSPFKINLWVSDGDLSREETLNINVINKNRKPEIIAVNPINGSAGDRISFDVTALDPDFETVTWEVSSLPLGASVTTDPSPSFDWQSNLTDTGNFQVTFIARDPQGFSDTSTVDMYLASSAIYSLSINSADAYPGERLELGIELDNKLPVGGFNLLIHYDPSALTVIGITNENSRAAGFEKFEFTVDENSSPGNIRIVGEKDLTGNSLLEVGSGLIATIDFRLHSDIAFSGIVAPVRFMFLDEVNFLDNTLSDSLGVKIEKVQIDYFDGFIEFLNLGTVLVGDINLNNIAYDIGDAIYFSNHFMNPYLYPLDPLQFANSDVNYDNIGGTIADLVALINVITKGASYNGKLIAGTTPKADILTVTDANRCSLKIKADFDIGAVLLTFKNNGNVDLGNLNGLIDNMTYDVAVDQDRIRILVYSLDGNSIKSGDQTILSIDNVENIEIIDLALATSEGVEAEPVYNAKIEVLPGSFNLYQNYPNPFNPTTNISFDLPNSAHVKLTVYNLLGEKVTQLIDNIMPAGTHTVAWDSRYLSGETISSGIYFYRLETEREHLSKKMLLLK